LVQQGQALLGRGATVTGRNPQILSGVVLAGANVLRRRDPLQPDPAGDGILTAEEAAGLDLAGAELLVLRGRGTGRGEGARGERGFFGRRRAFHVAGAGARVASLGGVDDAATGELMGEFYQPLWRPKAPGKLGALRQAQLALLRSYDPGKGVLVRAPAGTRPV